MCLKKHNNNVLLGFLKVYLDLLDLFKDFYQVLLPSFICFHLVFRAVSFDFTVSLMMSSCSGSQP